MGQLFARLLTELPNADLCGVADTMHDKADAVGERFGVPAFSSAQALSSNVEIDAVIIATDESQHVQPVREAARADKPILLEKPLATCVADARVILQEVANAGVPLMVAHCVRFDPRYAQARAAILNGELGLTVHLAARRNAPRAVGQRLAGRCSVSMFLGVHDSDFMLWATGRSIIQVYGLGHGKLLEELGVHDSILSVLRFDDDTIASLETSWIASVPSWQFEAVGTRGMLQITTPNLGSMVHAGEGIQFARPLYGFEPLPSGNTLNVYQAELMHFLECVAEGRPFIIQPEEALMAVAVAEAIDRSVASGQPETPEVLG
jgi:predicted dehydrogenase